MVEFLITVSLGLEADGASVCRPNQLDASHSFPSLLPVHGIIIIKLQPFVTKAMKVATEGPQ
jgi:hypothetical protein